MVASRSILGRMLDAVAKSAATRVAGDRAERRHGARGVPPFREHYLDEARRHYHATGEPHVTAGGQRIYPTGLGVQHRFGETK